MTDMKHGVTHCERAIFILTSTLATDEIKRAAPSLRKMADKSDEQPGEYTRVLGNFVRRIHPALRKAFKGDDFLGRIDETVVFLPFNKKEVRVCCGLISSLGLT